MPIGRGKVARGSKGGASGYAKKAAGKGNGGPAGKADPGKNRNVKNMGSAGPKSTGPKFGKGNSKRTY